MSNEYKLSYTATEIDEKLGKIDTLATIEAMESILTESKSYTDSHRLAYSNIEEVEIIPEANYSSDDGGIYRIYYPHNINDGFYYVYVNGTKYSVEKNSDPNYEYYEDEHIYIDFWPDFIFINFRDESNFDFITVSVTQDAEVVSTIDKKYLPNDYVKNYLNENYLNNTVYKFNGDSTGKNIVEDMFVQISYDTPDLNKCIKGIGVFADGSSLEISKNDIVVQYDREIGISALTIPEYDSSMIVAIVVDKNNSYKLSAGLYVLCIPQGYVSYLEFETEIMDSKYLSQRGVGYMEDSVIYQIKNLDLEYKGISLEYNDGDYYSASQSSLPFMLIEGKHYTVIWNGVEYDFIAEQNPIGPDVYIGNFNYITSSSEYGKVPFYIGTAETYNWDTNEVIDTYMIVFSSDSQATFSISNEVVHSIDPKYLIETIDLDSYGIGYTILYLFDNGGGSETLTGTQIQKFWSDVATNKVLRLKLGYDDFYFIIDQCVRAKSDNNTTVQLAFNTVVTDGDGAIYNISVSIRMNGSNTAIITVNQS